MKKVLIIGATSAIAHETARCFAVEGARIMLVGRNSGKLRDNMADLKSRGASEVFEYIMDLCQYDQHPNLIEHAWNTLEGIDEALIAHGSLGDQKACEKDFNLTRQEFETNFLSVASLLTLLANKMEEAGQGSLAVISSVAGDRGRQSNYIYGSAKAALNVFMQGLRNRLEVFNISVTTIQPGFVDTPMTAGINKTPLFASAKKVGEGIYKAMRNKKNVVYLPFYWRGIMLGIKSIPESVFKRMKL